MTFLIITDNHPELIHFSKYLDTKKIEFTILTPFYFKAREKKLLQICKVFFRPLSNQLHGRLLNYQSNASKHLRYAFLTDMVRILFVKRGIFTFNNTFNFIISRKLQKKLNTTLKIRNITHIICNESTLPYLESLQIDKNRVVVICIYFHGIPSGVNRIRNELISDYPNLEKFEPLLKEVESCTKIDLYVFLSRFAELCSIPFLPNFSKHCVIPIGSLNHFSRPIKQKPEKIHNIISLGRMSPMKGFFDYIKLARMLPKYNFTACGIISRNFHNHLLQNNLIPNNLSIVENPGYRTLNSIIMQNEVFLSLSYYEGFGISILEAMEAGLIPIATNHSIAAEILKGTIFSKNIIKPGDIEGVINLLREIDLISSLDYVKLQKQAHATAAEYSFHKFSEILLNRVYDHEIQI